jgi:NADH-quinone oxidoreductase subunit G
VAHASVLTDGLREHADVVFPADSYAEKEGTVVHPDGRIQRLRTAIRRPGAVRAGWWVLAELAKRTGYDSRVLTSPMAFAQLVAAVPFYRGLTLEEVGGRGVRWPPRPEASGLATVRLPSERAGLQAQAAVDAEADRRARTNGALRLGRYRPIWAAPEVEISPALKFAVARQQLELSPEDAARLGIGNGEDVAVAQNGTTLRARAVVRTGIRPGSAFLADGLEDQSANAFTEPLVEVRKR